MSTEEFLKKFKLGECDHGTLATDSVEWCWLHECLTNPEGMK